MAPVPLGGGKLAAAYGRPAEDRALLVRINELNLQQYEGNDDQRHSTNTMNTMLWTELGKRGELFWKKCPTSIHNTPKHLL
jgi:hypothetical protein